MMFMFRFALFCMHETIRPFYGPFVLFHFAPFLDQFLPTGCE